MSGPSADSPAVALPREKPAYVLGALACLALAALFVWVVADQRTRSFDPAEAFARWFEPRELPFGIVARQAATAPTGEEILVLGDPSAPPEPPRKEPPKPADPAAPGAGEFDWASVPVGERGRPPLEVTVMRFPDDAEPREIEAAMRGAPDLRGDFRSVGAQGGKRTVERGKLAWREYECDFVHEREFEAGGTFRDALRVNIARPGAPWIFMARWPRGTPASIERAEELLAALVPRS